MSQRKQKNRSERTTCSNRNLKIKKYKTNTNITGVDKENIRLPINYLIFYPCEHLIFDHI